MTHNCVGIFCEDIREETSGTHTVVGVMPDNINLVAPDDKQSDGKLLFPKMGFYIRVSLDTQQPPPKLITASVAIPGIEFINLGAIGTADVEKAFADAAVKSSPLVGVIFKGVFAPITLSESGVATLHVVVDGEDQICGILNVQVTR
jgi:hypothetical protein